MLQGETGRSTAALTCCPAFAKKGCARFRWESRGECAPTPRTPHSARGEGGTCEACDLPELGLDLVAPCWHLAQPADSPRQQQPHVRATTPKARRGTR